MRYLLSACLLSGLLFGCKRERPIVPDTPVNPSIPAEEKITTQIVGFATNADNSIFDNTVVYTGGANWAISSRSFLTDNIILDKYAARITLNDPLYVEKRKTIAITSAGINYIRLKPMKLESLGQLTNGQGGTYAYEGTGSINFPANSIYQTATSMYPGYYGPDIQTTITLGYLSPLSTDFGVSIPCYSFADDNHTRVFLASVGIVAVYAGWMNPLSDSNSIDLYPNNTATLKVPIPASLLSLAPNSISLWLLRQGQWVLSGVAQKTGNIYMATINKLGTYNLAVPVKGVYKTVRLRTSNNTPIVDATVRIKYNQEVIAESQSDWDGNALIFLPSAQNLNIELYQVWQNNEVVYTGSIDATDTNPNLDVIVSSASPRIYQFSGDAYNCDGTPVVRGKVILYNTSTGLNFHIPVDQWEF